MLDTMHLSKRTAWEPDETPWAAAVARAKAGKQPLFDLTRSNPQQCGLGLPPEEVLPPLSNRGALHYAPDPLGMPVAREAVCGYYAEHGATVLPHQLCLTTSTSEAYSFLLRVLCDPGDEVLIARPSYPLLGLLLQIEDVRLREYPLFFEPGLRGTSGWRIDFDALEGAINGRTRAVIVVHPNNPTGHFVSAVERAALEEICLRHHVALVVDEVFLDYTHPEAPMSAADRATFAGGTGCLTFVMSGLSKVCALPQMKVSWLLATGPEKEWKEAMRRLEIVADTFLSMNAPVQFGLPQWLARRAEVQQQILARVTGNLAALDDRLQGSMGERLVTEGGWTAVLRVPRTRYGYPFSEAALHRGVLVQPAELYGLREGRCVVSLLTDPDIWKAGLAALPL